MTINPNRSWAIIGVVGKIKTENRPEVQINKK